MKLIPKFKNGNYFQVYTPSSPQNTSTDSTDSQVSSKSADKPASTEAKRLETKDVLEKILSAGGLTNDVNFFAKELMEKEKSFDSFTSSNYSSILPTFAKANEIMQNAREWKESKQTAYQTGGLDELAVGNMGEMFVRGEDGKIKQLRAADYAKNRDKYATLTVSELLNARQNDPSLAYNTSIFSVANNSVGNDKILEHVNTLIDKLGMDKNAVEQYVNKSELDNRAKSLNVKSPTKEQAYELDQLKNLQRSLGNSPDGIYKFTKVLESNSDRLRGAFGYIWNTLPQNYKNKLTAIQATNGGDISSPDNIIKEMLAGKVKTDSSTKIDYDGTLNTALKGGDKKDSQTELSQFEMFVSGKNPDMGGTFMWNDNTGKKMEIPVINTQTLSDVDNTPIGAGMLSKLTKAKIANVLDLSKVTMGGKPVSDFNSVVIGDATQSARAYVPVNSDGTANLGMLKKFKENEEVVKRNPKWTISDINHFYANSSTPGVRMSESPDGVRTFVESNYLKPFLLFHAYTTDQTTVGNNNPYLEELKDGDKDQATALITPIAKDAGIKLKDWTNWGTAYYKGLVMIPFNQNASVMASAISGHGPITPKTDIGTVRINKATQMYGNQISAAGDRLNQQ